MAPEAAQEEGDEDDEFDRAEMRELPPEDGFSRAANWTPAVAPVAHLGLPYRANGMRAVDGPSLSRWQPTDGGHVRRAPIASEGSRDGPRLCVACMLRAAPLSAVDGFLRYYHAIGFESVALFFDRPHEDAAAIELARAHASAVGGVTIHLCDDGWWQHEREVGCAFVRARKAAAANAAGPVSSDSALALQYMGDVQKVALFEQTDDVQTRQCLVMDRALRDAWAAGFDWLLQLDIDELIYLPRAAEREDARRFFGAVPEAYDRVAFHNHEVLTLTLT